MCTVSKEKVVHSVTLSKKSECEFRTEYDQTHLSLMDKHLPAARGSTIGAMRIAFFALSRGNTAAGLTRAAAGPTTASVSGQDAKSVEIAKTNAKHCFEFIVDSDARLVIKNK